MIVPVVVNGSIIQNYPKHLIKSKQKLFRTYDYNNYVQKYTDLKEFQDECIQPLIMGSQSQCNVIPETNTTVQFISENKLLVNNAQNAVLSSNCGPDNRTLTGNFVITFRNCTIIINTKEFQSYEWESEIEEIQGALHNIQITRQMIEKHDISLINQENIANRKRLNNIYLQQINHQKWIWTLSGTSLSTIGLLILIIFFCCYRSSTTIKIDTPNSIVPNEIIQHDENTPYFNLLQKAGITSKDEDALSSPPGGVMIT